MAKLEYYQVENEENKVDHRNVIRKILLYSGETYSRVWCKEVEDSITPTIAFRIVATIPHENLEGRIPESSDIMIIDRGGKTVEAYRCDGDRLFMLEDVFSADAI